MDFQQRFFVPSHHLIRSVPHLLNLINAVAKPLECAPQVHQQLPQVPLSGLNCHVGIFLPTALECQLHVRQKISLKAQDATESFKHFEPKISNMYWHWFCVSNFQVQPLSPQGITKARAHSRWCFLAFLSLSSHPPFSTISLSHKSARLSYSLLSYCRARGCRLIFAGCCRRHCSFPSSFVANSWRYPSLRATAWRNRLLDPRMYPAAGAAFCNVVATSWISFKPKAKWVVSRDPVHHDGHGLKLDLRVRWVVQDLYRRLRRPKPANLPGKTKQVLPPIQHGAALQLAVARLFWWRFTRIQEMVGINLL